MEATSQHSHVRLEKRRARRGEVEADIPIRRMNSRGIARLTDLSTTGCRIAFAGILPKGTTVWLTLPGLNPMSGQVSWSDNFTAGVRFDNPLHPAIAARFTPQADPDGKVWSPPRTGEGHAFDDRRCEQRFDDLGEDDPELVRINGVEVELIDASASGLRVRLRRPLKAEIGDKLRIEIACFAPYEGTLAWLHDDEAGIALPEPQIDFIEPEEG